MAAGRACMASPALDLDALQRAVDGLRTQQESVQRERAELQSMKATVEENLAQFKQRVKLNVGGSKFETTLTTLTRYPESMLGAMFSGRHEVPPDDEGYVFIDRDGKQFGTILNFLRTGTLDVPSSTKAATELKREMEYYQLPFDGCSNHEDTDTPIVETVLTQAAATNYHLQPLDMRAHTAKVQEKLQANPRLRIVANNVSKGGGGQSGQQFDRIITTLATHHAPLCHRLFMKMPKVVEDVYSCEMQVPTA